MRHKLSFQDGRKIEIESEIIPDLIIYDNKFFVWSESSFYYYEASDILRLVEIPTGSLIMDTGNSLIYKIKSS